MKRLIAVLVLFIFLQQTALAAQKAVIEPVDSDFDKELIPKKIELIDRKLSGVYQVKGMNRLLRKQRKIIPAKVKTRIRQWNDALDAAGLKVPVYMYFVDQYFTQPQELSFSEESKIDSYLRKNLHLDGFDHLKFSTFAQFCSYFYATDHHWNFRGSYQGYVDIVRMLLGEKEKVLRPTGIQVLPVIFNGSMASKIHDPLSTEKFAFYLFDDYPQYTTIINGKRKRYNSMDKYIAGSYSKLKYANHYTAFYGSNYGLIEFDSKEKSVKKNLLIIGDSYSNPVQTMLTKHYKTVIFVDLRHYHKVTKRSFSLQDAVKKYNIDQVLFLGSYQLLTDSEFRDLKP